MITMNPKDLVLRSYDENAAIRLVKMMIETPSVTGDENRLAVLLADFMKERGLEVELQEVREGAFQTIGRVKGDGSGMSMMLCGHMDIFPPPASMTDPYKAVVKDGRIHGAGVADMKAGTAAMVMAADAVLRSGVDLKGDLVVAAVREEEIGGVGVNYMLQQGVTTDMGIVPESTNLRISTTGAGIAKFKVSTLGRSVHVSNKEDGVDAIEKMTKVVSALKDIEFTHEPDPRVPKLPRFAAGTIIGGRGRDYDLRGAQNLSDYCSLLVNVRFWKSMTVESIESDLKTLLEEIKRGDPEFMYELERGYGAGPFESGAITRHPKDVPLDSPIVKILQESHRYVTGGDLKFRGSEETVGNDDGANMNEAGIHTVTYGPGPGSNYVDEYYRLPLQSRWIDTESYHTSAKVMALSSLDVCTRKR